MKVAWLFPGQGSQSVGMAKDVLAASPAARDVFGRPTPRSASRSRGSARGPAETLTLTANTQPAIVATSSAILAAIRERSPGLAAPAFAAGHSLGEYSALVAAGALALEDAVRLVRARGRAMQDAVPAGRRRDGRGHGPRRRRGSRRSAREAARGRGRRARRTSTRPGRSSSPGTPRAVARAERARRRPRRGKAIPLKVSAPFHCALMAPAARVVAARARATSRCAPPRFPVVANVDARPNTDAGAREGAPRAPGRRRRCGGTQSVRAAWPRAASTRALEIGPGQGARRARQAHREGASRSSSVGDAAVARAGARAFLRDASCRLNARAASRGV